MENQESGEQLELIRIDEAELRAETLEYFRKRLTEIYGQLMLIGGANKAKSSALCAVLDADLLIGKFVREYFGY